MQLGLSEDQLHFIKVWIKDPTVIGIIWWLLRRGFNKLGDALHKVITDNANRIRDELNIELRAFINEQFEKHEQSAFQRLDKIQNAVKVRIGKD